MTKPVPIVAHEKDHGGIVAGAALEDLSVHVITQGTRHAEALSRRVHRSRSCSLRLFCLLGLERLGESARFGAERC